MPRIGGDIFKYMGKKRQKYTKLKAFIYCISKLNPEKPQREQTIVIDDFVKQFGDINKNSAYKQVKQAIETLYECSIKVKYPKNLDGFSPKSIITIMDQLLKLSVLKLCHICVN